MIGVLARAAGLMAIYLLVLTSIEPGDIAVGAVLGLGVALVLKPPGRVAPRMTTLAGPRATAAVFGQTFREMAVGSWRTARFCLGADSAPGFVEIPRGLRTRGDVALWGMLTGEAPDEIVIDIDDERNVLIVHLLDASDPDAVRARHHDTYLRWRGLEVD